MFVNSLWWRHGWRHDQWFPPWQWEVSTVVVPSFPRGFRRLPLHGWVWTLSGTRSWSDQERLIQFFRKLMTIQESIRTSSETLGIVVSEMRSLKFPLVKDGFGGRWDVGRNDSRRTRGHKTDVRNWGGTLTGESELRLRMCKTKSYVNRYFTLDNPFWTWQWGHVTKPTWT